MAKKLSVVQLKQQANVLKSLEAVEQAAAVLYADFVGCWFSMEFENFPGSLLVRCQFNSANLSEISINSINCFGVFFRNDF